MFGLFGKEKENSIPGEWTAQTRQMQERWSTFLQKLEERMEELCTAAIGELRTMREQAGGRFDMNLHQVHSGIIGQLTNMEKKLREVYEQQVNPYYNQLDKQLEEAGFRSDMAYEFREACSLRQEQFEKQRDQWKEQLERAMKPDNEAEYQAILQEYEEIKHKFDCSQCGAGIMLDKIYFTTTYLKCEACGTQNTFQPSTRAAGLPHLARTLAEERTAHLLKRYQETSLPEDYYIYLRKMFDEWNCIVPDMEESNEKFYQRLLNDFKRTIV